VVVGFGFDCYAWNSTWRPPGRTGFLWVNGVWVGRVWTPGYWAPSHVTPVGYSYVQGYWQDDTYVEGFYRSEQRDDGDWAWVDGYYLEDGTHVRGHWMPTKPGPEGYMWEPGFWDGEVWVEGFWRPEFRMDFAWVSAHFDGDGIYHSGYWAPLNEAAGYEWIPGWFDGNQWVEGYWVEQVEYQTTNPSDWAPEDGWQDGWDVGGFGDGELEDTGAPAVQEAEPVRSGMPLGLPVDVTDAP
jgi:hypothetical protein